MEAPSTRLALHRGELVAYVLFALASVGAVIGVQPLRTPDSASYLNLDLLGRTERLWTVPLIYSSVPNDAWRVGVQTAVFVGAWILYARTVASMVGHRVVRVLAVASILSLALAAIDWNVIILSESLTNSLTVGLLAIWLRFDRRPSAINGAAFVATAALWIFARQANVLIIVPVALALIVPNIRSATRNRRSVAGGFAVVALCGLATIALGHGDRSIQRHNSTELLVDRILPDAGAATYFREHGLPVGGVEQALAGRYAGHEGVFAGDARLVRWVDHRFLSTYASYLAGHPTHAVATTIRGVGGLTRPVQLGFTRLRRLAPIWRLVWGRDALLVLVALAGGGTAAAASRRRWHWTSLVGLGGVGVVAAGWWLIVIWLLSGAELGRLGVSANILLRLALIAIVVQSAEALIPRAGTAIPLANRSAVMIVA